MSIPGYEDDEGKTENGQRFKTFWSPKIVQLTEQYLGKGKRVNECNSNQVQAVSLIVADLKNLINSNK
jgi:hypothetical protein